MSSRSLVRSYRGITLRSLLGLLAAGALALSIPVLAQSGGAGDARRASQAARSEIQIMQKLIDAHQAAVELGLIGEQLTSDREVKAFCATYAARQQAELDQLRAWLKAWHHVSYASRFHMGDDELLDLAGDDFTLALLDKLIGWHHREMALARQAGIRDGHDELRALARAMITTERGDLPKLRAWLENVQPAEDGEAWD